MSGVETAYRLQSYGGMIRDRIRLDAYLAALRESVRAGSTVLELGTGTGFFAVTAAMLGAKKVFAIEPNDVILAAEEIAKANNVENKIEFIQADSREVELPEKADVMISDLRGRTPFFGKHFEIVADARNRLLAKGGLQIGLRDEVYVAACEAPAVHGHLFADAHPLERVDFSPLRSYLSNTSVRDDIAGASLSPQDLVTDSAVWTTIDYTTDCQQRAGGTVSLECHREGTIHGLAVWFRAILTEDIAFDTAPKSERQTYGRMFCPLPEPRDVVAGDAVQVTLNADLVNDEYLWRWRTRITDVHDKVVYEANQSTFHAVPLSRDKLANRALGFVPTLSTRGESYRYALDQMNGVKSLSEIATELMERYPDEFATVAMATRFVGDLSTKFAA